MDLSGIAEFVAASKSAVELLKSAYEVLPKGDKRDEVEKKVKMAEDILKRSDAKLAKELGYTLCECTFPPQIMLWKQQQSAYVCPNPECGRADKIATAEDFNTPVTQYDPFWQNR